MNSEDQQQTSELELKSLEVRVDQLIHTLDLLKQENRGLRSRQSELLDERAELIEKTELARNRVEAMITRLKSMEANS
ncbi:MAG: TIGR02449 family protein [Candidatus Sedimenticola sp. (ex Thyasira tokunagai)]